MKKATSTPQRSRWSSISERTGIGVNSLQGQAPAEAKRRGKTIEELVKHAVELIFIEQEERLREEEDDHPISSSSTLFPCLTSTGSVSVVHRASIIL